MSNAIKEAIDTKSAHELAEALGAAGLNVERRGNRNADDEAVQVEGWGLIYWSEAKGAPEGWVVRAYTDNCDYPMDAEELLEELTELIEWASVVADAEERDSL